MTRLGKVPAVRVTQTGMNHNMCEFMILLQIIEYLSTVNIINIIINTLYNLVFKTRVYPFNMNKYA